MYNEFEIVNLKIKLDVLRSEINQAFGQNSSLHYLKAVFFQKRKIEKLMREWEDRQKSVAAN